MANGLLLRLPVMLVVSGTLMSLSLPLVLTVLYPWLNPAQQLMFRSLVMLLLPVSKVPLQSTPLMVKP